MHGTWVNDKRITPHRDVPITTGDVLIFGTEVIHGAGKLTLIKVLSISHVSQKGSLPSKFAASVNGSIHSGCLDPL